jgi:hypothetical protein
MKTIYLCAVAWPLLAGCSYESAPARSDLEVQHTLQYRDGGKSPENDDNPYDYVGQIHNEIAYSYHNDTIKPVTIAGVIARVGYTAELNSRFTGIKEMSYSAPAVYAVSNIQIYGTTLLPGILAGSGMSTAGKEAMVLLTTMILAEAGNSNSFEENYDAIADFENAVLAHTGLTVYDKKVLLIVSSVGRHATYLVKKKPKKNTDPDWNVLIINLVGTVEGALKSEAEAINMGLVCGVLENL